VVFGKRCKVRRCVKHVAVHDAGPLCIICNSFVHSDGIAHHYFAAKGASLAIVHNKPHIHNEGWLCIICNSLISSSPEEGWSVSNSAFRMA
jgi:hypothetical protein